MNLKRISVKLSWMLRHCQTPRYIDLNGGWADVDVIIKALKERFPDFDRKTLELIVAQDEKGRYSFDKTGTQNSKIFLFFYFISKCTQRIPSNNSL